jgi:hypothetical protein
MPRAQDEVDPITSICKKTDPKNENRQFLSKFILRLDKDKPGWGEPIDSGRFTM